MSRLVKGRRDKFVLSLKKELPGPTADIIDNGHTIQVNAKTGETMTVGDKSYALLQFHLHA